MVTLAKPSDCWRTPKALCDLLGRFDLDPCSGPGSHVQAARTFSLEAGEDGLAEAWDNPDDSPCTVFVNPPYSSPGEWCSRLAAHPDGWVALVKLDPTTRWWSELMGGKPRVGLFRRRLRFEPPAGWIGKPMTANFPSALVWKRWVLPGSLLEHLWT